MEHDGCTLRNHNPNFTPNDHSQLCSLHILQLTRRDGDPMRVRIGTITLALLLPCVGARALDLASRLQRGTWNAPIQQHRRCFNLQFSPSTFWSEVPSDKLESNHLEGVPKRIEFSDSIRVSPWRAAYVSHSVLGPATKLAEWKRASGDSIEIIIPTISWAVGAHLMLIPKGDTLRGTARVYLDVQSGPRQTAQVLAIRRSCSRPT